MEWSEELDMIPFVGRRPVSCDYINGSRARLCWCQVRGSAPRGKREDEKVIGGLGLMELEVYV